MNNVGGNGEKTKKWRNGMERQGRDTLSNPRKNDKPVGEDRHKKYDFL